MKKMPAREIPLAYVTGGAVAVVLAGGTAVYAYYSLYNQLATTKNEFATATTTLGHDIAELSAKLADSERENSELHTQLHDEIDRNNEYGKKVESLVSTVAMLDKLSKTDRELLQKYSKVFFLSENFVPSALSDLADEFILRKGTQVQIHTQIKPQLERMIHNATADGSPLLVRSAYRSFSTQAATKNAFTVVYGAGTANSFSADQGYSEHQLGSTVDFTTPKLGENIDTFGSSNSYTWLQQHAHEYGFVLSYPKGNAYYIFEPWHWRYVGVELATKLHTEGKYFYDLDQREINTYLVKIFD